MSKLFQGVLSVKNGDGLARHHNRVISEFIESVLDDLHLTNLERNIVGVAIRAEVEERLVPGLTAVLALLLEADPEVLGDALPRWLERASSLIPEEAVFLSDVSRRLDPDGAALLEENAPLFLRESLAVSEFNNCLWEMAR